MHSCKLDAHERGFTLIELLIGLTVSLIILAGAVVFLVTSSRNLTNQSSEDLIQENARFAFEIMSSNIRLAGYNVSTRAQTQAEIISNAIVCDVVSGGALQDCNENSVDYEIAGENRDSDSVAFSYVVNSGRTCAGNDITQETKVVTVFFVADIDADGIPSLYCRSFESRLDPLSQSFVNYDEPIENATPIVDGIDSLQIQYGVDTNPNPDQDSTTDDGSIDRYSSYDNVSAAVRGNVRAIKIGLLVSSGQAIASEQGVTDEEVERTYQVFDGTIDITDRAIRQIYSTTVFIPNRIN